MTLGFLFYPPLPEKNVMHGIIVDVLCLKSLKYASLRGSSSPKKTLKF